jgi:hypothetical protein
VVELHQALGCGPPLAGIAVQHEAASARPVSTEISFQPRLKVSPIDTFMPWPAFGLWVWQASPASITRVARGWPTDPAGTSSNLSVSRWPIS